MKKKIMPILIVIVLILLTVGVIGISAVAKKYSPSKEHADLNKHYDLAAEDQVAIILNYQDLETKAVYIDGKLHLDYNFVHDNINSRFYWDHNENVLLYTTANAVISANPGETSYHENKNAVDFGSTIVTPTEDSCWINIDFVKLYSDMLFEIYENPNRVVITNQFGSVNTALAKGKTSVRVLGGIKSPILKDVAKKDTLFIISEDQKWTRVMTEDGIIGYIKTNKLSKKSETAITSDFVAEDISHITRDHDICLGWNAIYSKAANGNIAETLTRSNAINVIAPTWFYMNGNDGNLVSKGDLNYVSYCHSQGVEVWPTVNNIDGSTDTTYVLTHTSTRQNLVNNIVSYAISLNLDGINLDLESVKPEVGDAYIQLVRELSVKLRANGIVLSVDNYAPSEYTAFYNRREQAAFADYVILMGYDQHWAGCDEAGSVASLDWVIESVDNTLLEVPANQLILAMPFYTRLWCEAPQGNSDGEATSYSISSKALGMNAANEQVAKKGAKKTWNPSAGQFYATYTENGNIYEIWLEDPSSAEERLKVMQEKELAGCAFWRLGFETSDLWDTIAKYIY